VLHPPFFRFFFLCGKTKPTNLVGGSPYEEPQPCACVSAHERQSVRKVRGLSMTRARKRGEKKTTQRTIQSRAFGNCASVERPRACGVTVPCKSGVVLQRSSRVGNNHNKTLKTLESRVLKRKP